MRAPSLPRTWSSFLDGPWPTRLVVALSGALHLRFLLYDRRLPTDLNGALGPLPAFYAALHGGPMPWSSLGETSGPWAFFVAVWLTVFGRNGVAYRCIDLVSMVAMLAMTGEAVRRQLGGRAAFVATAFVASSSLVSMHARTGWIHIPELALLLAAAAALTGDPAVRAGRTRAALAGFGLLALLVRPSAAIFLAGLGAVAAWGAAADGPGPLGVRMRRAVVRLWPLVLGSALAFLPALSRGGAYFLAKFGARARYVAQLPDLTEQLRGFGGAPLAVGLGVFALVGFRTRGPLRALALTWIAGALIAWGVFRAGMDNFPIVVPAAAFVAAAAALRFPRLSMVLAAVGPLIVAAYQLGPESDGVVDPNQSVRFPRARESMFSYDVPYRGIGGASDILGLIDALCYEGEACQLWVDQGLGHPYGEDGGTLELFLLNRPDVVLHDLRNGDLGSVGLGVDALVYTQCFGREEAWRARNPASDGVASRLRDRFSLQRVWVADAGDCLITWWSPEGRVRNRSRLPPTNTPG